MREKNYEANDLNELKSKILKIIDDDRNRAVTFLDVVNEQIQQQPQAVLLIGDKATQALDNLRKHAGNMIKIYQIEKRKMSGPTKPTDIEDILNDIEKKEKLDAGKNTKDNPM